MFTSRSVGKEDVVDTYNGVLLSQQKNEIITPFIAAGMDLEILALTEVKSDRKTNISLIYGILKKIQINLFTNRNKPQTSKTNLWLPKGRSWGRDGLGV